MRAGPALAAALLTVVAAVGESALAQAASRFGADILHQRQPGDTISLTRGEVVTGLRELLDLAASSAVQKLGAADGFLADEHVRIALPDAFREAYGRLKPFGMAGPLDELEIAVNRAAEATVRDSLPGISAAIARQKFDDALDILRSGDARAAAVLKQSARNTLAEALTPVMAEKLADAGAAAALQAAATRYAPALLRTDMNDMLLHHATAGAVDGLFYYVALEELAIRSDQAKWSSESLRRVFGG